MSPEESLRDVLARWRSGDETAASEIYDRYQARVLEEADRKLGGYMRGRVSPETIMVMALQSVLRCTHEKTPEFDCQGSLWAYVAEVTRKKILKQVEFHTAQKRDIRKETRSDWDSEEPSPDPPANLPAPQELAQLADDLENIRGRLKPDEFVILTLKLEGYSNAEIGEQIGCCRHTVRNKIKRIEEVLRQWANNDSGQ